MYETQICVFMTFRCNGYLQFNNLGDFQLNLDLISCKKLDKYTIFLVSCVNKTHNICMHDLLFIIMTTKINFLRVISWKSIFEYILDEKSAF